MLGTKKGKKKPIEKHPLHVKTGDTVLVLSGKDKGKTGIIRRVFTEKNRVLVEGINIVTKAQRGNPMMGQQGGLTQREAPIAAGKVMLYDIANNKPTRIRHSEVNGKKTRVAKSGHQFDV